MNLYGIVYTPNKNKNIRTNIDTIILYKKGKQLGMQNILSNNSIIEELIRRKMNIKNLINPNM